MTILEDLLNEDLTTDSLRITVSQQYDTLLERAVVLGDERGRSPKAAKSLRETYQLIKQVIDNYQTRANTPATHKVIFTEEEPDEKAQQEMITFSLIRREPGAISKGPPMQNQHHNLTSRFREEIEDVENPGYRILTTGYWHDNIIRLTCWARTNKAANARAEWLEDVLEEYMWFFKAEGVDRFLFHEQHADISVDIKGNKWYGRPLDYFVRTEKIKTFKEKSIEEILINFSTNIET
jgi:hypothetical protein